MSNTLTQINCQSTNLGTVNNPRPNNGPTPMAPSNIHVINLENGTTSFEIIALIDVNNPNPPTLVANSNNTAFFVQYDFPSETPTQLTLWNIQATLEIGLAPGESINIYTQDINTGTTNNLGKGEPETSRGTETVVQTGVGTEEL